jgi:hypothetical protein
MESEKIAIYDIRIELEKIASSGVVPQRTADACRQAASLLQAMREVVIKSPDYEIPDEEKVRQLRRVLAIQGEG